MDGYLFRQIDQLCDYDTRLTLRQLNHFCHAELQEIMFGSVPLSKVIVQRPDDIARVALTHGWESLLKYAIHKGFHDWNEGLHGACVWGA